MKNLMRQRGRIFNRRIAAILVLVLYTATLVPTISRSFNATASVQPNINALASGIASWNPNVSCSATLVTTQYILGSAYPNQTLSGSPYQTSSTSGGIPAKRALSPPCTITNISGQTLSSFVEIDNVTLHYYFYETRDCSAKYNAINGGAPYPNGTTFCDSTGNVYAAGTTGGFVHVEFDQDWMAAGFAGPSTTYANNDTIAQVKLPCTITSTCVSTVPINVQGFVYWDPEGHWELHALTAWQFVLPDFSVTSSPNSLSLAIGSSGTSTITLSSLNGFSGSVSLSESVSATSPISFVPPTASLAPSIVALTSNGTASSTLTVSTSLLTTPGTYTVTVTGTSGSITHSTTVAVTVTVGL